MHGPSIATLLVAATLGLARPSPAGTSDAVDEARRRLARDDGASAVAILEEALPEAGAAKGIVLDLLRPAYELAARQAQAAGKSREAETYRENIRILGRKPRPAQAPPVVPTPTPEAPAAAPAEPRPPDPTSAPPALPDIAPPPGSIATPAGPPPPFATDRQPEAAPKAEATGPTPPPSSDPAPLLPIPAEAPPGPDVATADAAFAAGDYAQAGRVYAELARENRLPAGRRDHWAYCRSVEVVRKINAHPQSEADWAGIRAEIARIRALNPNNWLGDYLANLTAERSKSPRKSTAGKLVVRGSAPEEPAIDRPARAAANRPPTEAATTPISLASNGSKGPNVATRPEPAVGRWQIRDTANFRIYHNNTSLAEKVAHAAEAVRREQTRRWTNALPRAPWQPQCEIYLYPTARQYATMTGQPEDSPGFSTMGMNGGRIISRRVNLRADHPALVPAVLPHEITHVILADLFSMEQIPRWADEGMAVLSEPADEQHRRAGDLVEPLAANRLFPVETLMCMDYPDNRFWGLYYAQSVSLTHFLVQQGTPAQMVQFLQGVQKHGAPAQRDGYEAELRKVYKIDGFPDLQRRWLAHARAAAPPRSTATASAPATGPDLKVR